MQLRRNEILTGLLVLTTVGVLTAVLILLGAPGLFKPLVTYRINLDNAARIKLGAPVLLAGRKIGQVEKLYSPVTRDEVLKAQAAAEALAAADAQALATPTPSAKPNASPTPAPPKPTFQARVDVRVDKDAQVFKDAHTRLISLGLLGETAIDVTQGTEAAGRAQDGELFAGERVPDFGEAIAKMLDVVKPVAVEATGTLKELQTTAQNLSKITDENSQLNMSLAQFRTFAENLTSMTARDSSLSLALKNVEKISTDLSANDNISVTLQNFRESSEKLKGVMADAKAVMGNVDKLGPQLKASGENLQEFTDTLKREPWRLIYKKTKEYPGDPPAATTENTSPRKTAKPPRDRR